MNKKLLVSLVGLAVILLISAVIYGYIGRESEVYEKIGDPKGALVEYFDLLSSGQYKRALAYHGSGFQILEEWNPDIDPKDRVALVKAGCELNGWNCLRIKNIIKEEKIASDEYRYIVQFERTEWTEEGESVFTVGPCCGEEDDGTRTRDFEFVVKNTANGYMVMYSPVYTP